MLHLQTECAELHNLLQREQLGITLRMLHGGAFLVTADADGMTFFFPSRNFPLEVTHQQVP